jgi:hypothetical protein
MLFVPPCKIRCVRSRWSTESARNGDARSAGALTGRSRKSQSALMPAARMSCHRPAHGGGTGIAPVSMRRTTCHWLVPDKRADGDFRPWNLLFQDGAHFVVLDRSRGEWGDPADDVACLPMNAVVAPFFAFRALVMASPVW